MSDAAWHCPHCEGIHPEYRKPALLANGRWTAKAEGDGKTVGFHLSSLYSPWLTWGEIAQEHHAAKDDPVRLKVSFEISYWTQPSETDRVLPLQVLVSWVPKIGLPHEPDYQPIQALLTTPEATP